jgi:predicted kinase
MAAPVLAGIPLVYEMLVGAGILAGGAVTANKMQKEIQKTIDTNPGVIDEALKNIFMGPARDLINPKMLEEIQNVKPTTTDQGTVKMKAMETEVSPEDQGMFIASPEQRAFLFGTRDTPSGTVLAPDAADIEAQRKEAAPKPLVTPMPKEQQDQTLSTPTPGQIKTETETFPAQEPQQQNIGTPVPEVMDTSILTKDKAAMDEEVKKEPFEFPSEEVRNQEINLSKNLFELSQNNPTLDMYEQYKNNPIIQNKIESSKKAYVNTSGKEGYGTADYWTNRKFVDDTVGYKDFIKKVYGDGAPKKNKEMYIVMGPSSAGKSTSIVDKLVPETGSYLADSDEIKKLLPEFTDGYNAGGVHKESSDINQRIMKIALARGDNIVYPTTGREPAKLAKEIERAEKYGYTPKVYLVTADREVLLMRNLGRMLSTNRVVDSDLLLNEQLIKDINKTYENLPEKYKAGKYDTSKDKR